jgi:hypothetical protein
LSAAITDLFSLVAFSRKGTVALQQPFSSSALRPRSWGHAEEKARELQRRLDAGESSPPTPTQPTTAPRTIAAVIETYILSKEGENKSPVTIQKLRYQLGLFEKFMAGRSKFLPADITPEDAVEFRATWKKMNDLTRVKFNSNLRGFLKRCCPKETRDDVLNAITGTA